MNTIEQTFNRFKSTAESSQMIDRQFFLSQIEVVDSESIKINGSYISISRKAFKDLIGILGLNESVLKVFDTTFGSDKTKMVLKLIQDSVARNKEQVSLYANPINREIQRITLQKKEIKGLDNKTYFSTLERMLNDNPNFEIKYFNADFESKDVHLVDKSAEFRVGKHSAEIFHPGIAFSTKFNSDTKFDSYTERLICTNGMVSRDANMSYSLNQNFNQAQWVKFFDHIETVKLNNWISPVYNQKIELAMQVNASLYEMKEAARLINPRNELKNDVNLWIPLNDTINRFKGIGVNPDELSDAQLKTAKTGTKVWDLINAVTDFASHDYNFKIFEGEKIGMKVAAGKMLMKDTYDMQNLAVASPFN